MVDDKKDKKDKKGNDHLTGMKEICNYLGMSESTVLIKHRDEDLPLAKGKDLIWHASKKSIDVWVKKMKGKEQKSRNMA